MDSRYNKQRRKTKVKEEYAIVLDIITNNESSFNENRIIQAIGFNTFTLLELMPKKDAQIKVGEKVYIGDGKRDQIQYIKRVLFFDKLTGTASSELKFAIQDIIDEREEFFVNFFNNAGPISLRRHALEIIPGVGKKHLKELLDKREDVKFTSFKDIKQSCSFLPNPQEAIAQRIIAELDGETEIKFFLKR